MPHNQGVTGSSPVGTTDNPLHKHCGGDYCFSICILLSEVHVDNCCRDKFVALGVRVDAVGTVE